MLGTRPAATDRPIYQFLPIFPVVLLDESLEEEGSLLIRVFSIVYSVLVVVNLYSLQFTIRKKRMDFKPTVMISVFPIFPQGTSEVCLTRFKESSGVDLSVSIAVYSYFVRPPPSIPIFEMAKRRVVLSYCAESVPQC